jgi:hypothetical protein
MGAALSKLAEAAWSAGSAAYGACVSAHPGAERGARLRFALEWLYAATAGRLWQRVPGGRPPPGSRTAAPDWADPAVRGRGRLPSHAPLRCFRDAPSARAFWAQGGGADAERATGTHRLCLSGDDWRFRLVSAPDALPQGFQAAGFDDNGWAKASVPSNWQCCGFDRPIYSNITYPFALDPPTAERRGTWCASFCFCCVVASTRLRLTWRAQAFVAPRQQRARRDVAVER